MRVSLKWLREYVDVASSPEEVARRLTLAGTEVGEIERLGGPWEGVRIGEVVQVAPHPNTDRLRLATVSLGDEAATVVCGAPNVAQGQKVAFGGVGARIIDPSTGQTTVLQARAVRGVPSPGMVLSEKELGLSDEHTGILVLPEDAPVGTPLADYLADAILELEVTPNRPDLLSMLGVAREVHALVSNTTDIEHYMWTAIPVKEPEVAYPEEGPSIESLAKVEIADPDLCPRYCAALIQDVKTGPSPLWMQRRLEAYGMRPINNVVDCTNYVMLEMGQPIHAFDFAKLQEGRIVIRRARDGESIVTIDGEERPLSTATLVIADGREPVAIAGVMGGLYSEVTEGTGTVFLESASFQAAGIRRTSQALKLRSEASLRFDKGLSPELPLLALRRVAKLLVEVCGGRACRGIIDLYPGQQERPAVVLPLRRIGQVLGVELDADRATAILWSLGFSCDRRGDGLLVTVPYWRTDVAIADDLVEELARVIGYDDLPTRPIAGPVPPLEPTSPRVGAHGHAPLLLVPREMRELRERARDLLVQAGMQEVITYSLVSMEDLERVLPSREGPSHYVGALARAGRVSEELGPLAVANPMSREHQYLRPTLRSSLLRTLARNRRLGADGLLALFEVGRIYMPQPGELPREVETLTGVIAGEERPTWHGRGRKADFYEARGYVELLMDGLGLEAGFAPVDEPALLPGRIGAILVAGERVGLLGQLHPRVVAAFELDEEVYLFEIDLEALLPHRGGPRRYRPLPRFPAVVEDIALIVDEETPAARVQGILLEEPLVAQASLFDVYRGEPVPAGKMSLAFTISYRAPNRTLTDRDVVEARLRLMERLSREVGATLRG